jgi:uncharacterized repeat protein (TIGR03803 family)
MPSEGKWHRLIVVLAIMACAWPATAVGQIIAQTPGFQTLYSFNGYADGIFPTGVVVDPATGDLYGATHSGGNINTAACSANSFGNMVDGYAYPGCGVLFKLAPQLMLPIEPQPWTKTLLWAFTGGSDGAYPADEPAYWVVLKNGALYGTTQFGGYANSTTCQTGCGTVFQFELASESLNTIYTFTGGCDSGGPYSGVVFGTNGNLYGNVQGGDGATPTDDLVYELTPPPQGQTTWSFNELHPYTCGGDSEIRGSLVVDRAGNLYGFNKQGSLFQLTPPTYNETTLAVLPGGTDPHGLTIQYLSDGTLVLYGTTGKGGNNNAGTVFKFVPATSMLTTLWNFTGGADGAYPTAPVVFDQNGMLYGTTFFGGNLNCQANGFPAGCGTVFKLDPGSGTLTTLHRFSGVDGWGGGGVSLDAKGNLYGTTLVGGNVNNCASAGGFPPGCGTVFKISIGPELN